MKARPTMVLAPDPQFPEKGSPTYESKFGQNNMRRGPLRFEEGIATDTDVPSDFQLGAMQGYVTAPGRPNHNANVYEKPAAQTTQERAHMGSAAWVESPTYLGEFAQGTNNDGARAYVQVDRGQALGQRWERLNPANVPD